MKTFISIICIFTIMIFIVGCGRGVYTTYWFSYPENSKPHNDDWKLIGKTSITEKEVGKTEKKIANIYVYDKDEVLFLEDTMSCYARDLFQKVMWEKRDTLRIIFFSTNSIGDMEFIQDNSLEEIKKSRRNFTVCNDVLYVFEKNKNKYIRQ